jgi:hypothetical protein
MIIADLTQDHDRAPDDSSMVAPPIVQPARKCNAIIVIIRDVHFDSSGLNLAWEGGLPELLLDVTVLNYTWN